MIDPEIEDLIRAALAAHDELTALAKEYDALRSAGIDKVMATNRALLDAMRLKDGLPPRRREDPEHLERLERQAKLIAELQAKLTLLQIRQRREGVE